MNITGTALTRDMLCYDMHGRHAKEGSAIRVFSGAEKSKVYAVSRGCNGELEIDGRPLFSLFPHNYEVIQ